MAGCLFIYLFTSRILGWIDKWHITLVARGYAAAASALIIPLLYRLSRELGLRRTAWLPPLAFAVTPLAIQYAHYGAVDGLLTFWVVWTSLLGLKAWNKGAKAYWVLAGVSLGLGLATKTTALIWGLIFVAAAGYEWVWTRRVLRGLTILICGGVGMLLGVLLASPYYLFDWPAFHSIMAMQAAKTVTGRILCTYHWQFLNVRPFLFEIEQLGRWAVGIPLTVLGGIGLIALWRKEILCLAKDWRWLLVLLPPTLYLWTWNTDEAEETFQVFDHPVVYIFERIVELNPEQIHNILERCVSP